MVFLNLAQNGVPALRVKTGGGFVQHQHTGVHRHHAGDGHPAFLAAGQLKGAFFQQFIAQPHELRGLLDAAGHLRIVQPHVFGAVGDVPCAGLLKQLVFGVLHHQSHQKAEVPQIFPLRPHIAAIHIDGAGGGLVQPVEMADEGGFSAAGGTHHPHEIPLLDGEGHIIKSGGGVRHPRVVHVAQMFDLYNFRHGVSFPRDTAPHKAGAVPVPMEKSVIVPAGRTAPRRRPPG